MDSFVLPRRPGNPHACSAWLFLDIAFVMLPYALWRDGRDVIPAELSPKVGDGLIF